MSCQYTLCSCNRSMPLGAVSAERLGQQLDAQVTVATQLCGRHADTLMEATKDGNTVVVGCTQEASLFRELTAEHGQSAPLRFVNVRETGGWGKGAYQGLPKMAALLAQAALPDQDPVASVSYQSNGRVLIVGPAMQALSWAERLHDPLTVTVLLTDADLAARMPYARNYSVLSGTEVALSGWLGAFEVRWQQRNPIDLDLCIRCNACLAACPEGAIDFLYQVNEDACKRHGECVRACDAAGAIDFSRAATERQGHFDLVLDLSEQPLLDMHQPPQGYFAPGSESGEQLRVASRIAQMVGEFEKPKYFQYKASLCAHGRNRKTGCNACIDICSTSAIAADGDRIRVEPHLCMGCGACSTVCPSGALRYAYPSPAHLGRRIKTMLDTFCAAGGEEPQLLLYGREHGEACILELGRLARAGRGCAGLPPQVIPVELEHVASAGIDIWLSALCHGARGITLLVTPADAPAYRKALCDQAEIAQVILNGLGYAGSHIRVVEFTSAPALDAALQVPAAAVPAEKGRFHVAADKRNTLDFALHHLARDAPDRPDTIALPPGAPFGAVAVNTDRCTLCMACTGACPSSALISTADAPRLRFVETNCVQCGLCVQTCPEQALSLVPRLSLAESARTPVVLYEAEPFHCIRCSKPIGTAKAVEGMLARLAGHGAFTGHADRLRMCGDCRVVDMMSNAGQAGSRELRRVMRVDDL